MKILQIIQRPQRRGAEIFACQLSIELQKLGHDVDVAYLFDQEDFQLDFAFNFMPIHATQSHRFWDVKARKIRHRTGECRGYAEVRGFIQISFSLEKPANFPECK